MTSGASMTCQQQACQKSVDVPIQCRDLADGASASEPTNLLAELLALEAEDAGEDAERDKVVVRDQLGRGEGRERVEEQVGGLGEVADREEVDARVDLEAVAAVPVAALVDELLGAVERRNDEVVVRVEQGDADDAQDEVDLGPLAGRLGERLVVRLDGRVLRARGGGRESQDGVQGGTGVRKSEAGRTFSPMRAR